MIFFQYCKDQYVSLVDLLSHLNLQVIYAPVVKVMTRKVYADPGQDEALLDCYVHGEPKPTVSFVAQTRKLPPTFLSIC